MRQVIAALLLLAGIGTAHAQPYQVVQSCNTVSSSGSVGSGMPSYRDVNGNVCVTTAEQAISGFGSLAVANSSALLSTLTVNAAGAAWPTAPGVVKITNVSTSAGILYVCPLGGTCSSTVGIPMIAGQIKSFTRPLTTMTVIAASTATAFVEF